MKKLLLFVLGTFLALTLHAEPIEFIVSASAGGPNDTVTRRLAEKIEKATGLQLVIYNKPGAAHTIAYNYVQTSNKPTLIMSTPEIVNHDVYPQLQEVFTAGHFTNIVFVSERSGIRSMKDLVVLSKLREINFGHGGIGSFSHQSMETICKTTLRCLDVPYKSAAEGMLGILNRSIDAYAIASFGAQQYLENDKYTAIYEIRNSRAKSWFKLFAKNVPEKDREAIIQVLRAQDPKFYTSMGFER